MRSGLVPTENSPKRRTVRASTKVILSPKKQEIKRRGAGNWAWTPSPPTQKMKAAKAANRKMRTTFIFPLFDILRANSRPPRG